MNQVRACACLMASVACTVFAPSAEAQMAVPWSTTDCGGGTSIGGGYAISGTIGQHDAGPGVVGAAGGPGPTVVIGGYWGGGALCRADFNNSGTLEVQDIFDFLNGWLALDPRADFNGVDAITVQDIFDFLNAWLMGCG